MAGPAWHGISINAVEDKPARDNFRAINLYLRSVSKSLAGGTETVPAEGLPGEPYVTIGNTGGLTQERALAVAAPVTLSDGGANGSVTIGASLTTPTIGYATAAAAGAATSLIRSDSTLLFPSALMPIGKTSTITLTDDGANQTFKGSLGDIIIDPADDIRLILTGSTSAGQVIIGGVGTSIAKLVVRLNSDATNAARALDFAVNTGTSGIGQAAIVGDMSTGISATQTTLQQILRTRLNMRKHNKTMTYEGLVIDFDATDLGDNTSTAQMRAVIVSTATRDNAQEATDWHGMSFEAQPAWVTNPLCIDSRHPAVIENPATHEMDALTLNQLDTGAGDSAHIFLNDKAGDPASPAAGQIWRNADALNVQTTAGGTSNLITAVINKTGAYTAIDSDRVITCDASGGAFTITLPATSGRTGRIYHIKKTDSSGNAVTVDGNASETIDGSTTVILSSQHDSIMLVSDGSNWHII